MRISDWSSDVCSSDLAESRKTEWVLAITGAIFGCELTIEAVRHAGKPCAAQGWHPGKAAFRIPKLRTQYPGLFSTIGADQRRGLDGHAAAVSNKHGVIAGILRQLLDGGGD